VGWFGGSRLFFVDNDLDSLADQGAQPRQMQRLRVEGCANTDGSFRRFPSNPLPASDAARRRSLRSGCRRARRGRG
jgi:hypothetical protein